MSVRWMTIIVMLALVVVLYASILVYGIGAFNEKISSPEYNECFDTCAQAQISLIEDHGKVPMYSPRSCFDLCIRVRI